MQAGGDLGEMESTKSVSEIYAPVAGEVTEVNLALEDAPELVNSDPYGEGWMVVLAPCGSGGGRRPAGRRGLQRADRGLST